jgi:RNA-directed DNA polymerase
VFRNFRTRYTQKRREADYRFYALYDKVYREDILALLTQAGSQSTAGHREWTARISWTSKSFGVERWLGELAQALKEKTYRTQAVRRVYIPKADGKQRPLGIPSVRDRVVHDGGCVGTDADLRS